MRKPLLDNLPDFVRTGGESTVTRNFSFELITPMFGGDSRSWELNRKAPVRAPSVKGQLRFWWRTMQWETDFKKLLAMENRLWGGKVEKETRIQSPVKIAVIDQNVQKEYKAEIEVHAVKGDVIPVYVAFPVTSAIRNDHRDVWYVQNLTFTLRVTYPKDLEKTVVDTLKLWTLFGGVGARTRRGCGSLYCEELLEGFTDETAIASFVKSLGDKGRQTAYPRIGPFQMAATQAPGSAASVWQGLIGSYAAFRQDRVPTTPRPGRSYWPEPDAIRTVVDRHSPHHKPCHPDGVWFPRATYGLPIITKFNTQGTGAGDPDPQVQLQPNIDSGDRWPSPVILKAIRLPGNKVLKAALVLDQSFPERLVLKQNNRTFAIPGTAHPFAPGPKDGKIMKNKEGKHLAPEETLYQALFKALGLKEVK